MYNPAVPETLDGFTILHQMFRVRTQALRALSTEERTEMVRMAAETLSRMESHADGNSAIFQLLGHKGDLLLIHFRQKFTDLAQVELDLAALPLFDYLEPTNSYVSMIELGLYDFTVRTHKELAEQGLASGDDAFKVEFDKRLAKQRDMMSARLYQPVPEKRYVCFYPMNKMRGEHKNWYMEPMEERARMMLEHGTVGRKYAGRIKQIISGSIGFDDWEWGVDLFADNPAVYKELVYEMRFDAASAIYGEFGDFFLGIRFPADQLATFLGGQLPDYPAE